MSNREQEMEHLEKLRDRHQANIRKLEEMLAGCGPLDRPLHRLTELELEQEQLRQVEAKLAALLEGKPGEAASPVSQLPYSLPPSSNPFLPLAGPVEPDACFNRDKERRKVFEFLNGGASVALIGESGVGKSSILKRICQEGPQRLGQRRQFIYLDLQLVDDEDDFYDDLCSKMGMAPCRGSELARALRGKHLILCLDEVEKMAWEGFTRRVRAQLRGLAQGSQAPLRLILAARTPLDRLFPDSEGGTSPLAGICLQVDVHPFDEDVAQAFIARRLEGAGIVFPDEEIERIWQETGGHPQNLMRACYELYSRLAGGER